MRYFAYGSNLNARGVAEWCRHFGRHVPALKKGRPANLENYRLCFPVYSEYWGGGIADIVYDPGKSVAGVLFELGEEDLEVLDGKVGRRTDAAGREVGAYRRLAVRVLPLDKGGRVEAVTYQGLNPDRFDLPPTQHYMDLLIQGAYAHGLSVMWIAYLRSFATHVGRKPRPPGTGDAAARL